jgi:putative aldouronate transport system substrate-binding protein
MKKPTLAKVVSFVLAVAMASAALAGCSTSAPSNPPASSAASGAATTAPVESAGVKLNPVGTFPICDTQQTFTIMTPPWGDTDPSKAWINGEYEKMTNVKIEWNLVPSDGWKDKRAIVFASGDLPDVVAGMDGSNLTPTDELQYASQGLILPLAKLIEDETLNFKKILAENPMDRKLIAQDDGDIYSFPFLSVCYHCNFSQKMFINKTWIDNLGLKMPTTTEEFYNVLKAFKEQDANKNGDPNDEIPLIGQADNGWHIDWDGFLMCAFTYSDPDTRMAVENGKLVFTPITDKYKEGLAYLNKLYSEGLIAPESFTNDNATNTKLNVASYPTAVIGAYPYAYQNYAGDTDIWKQYEILPPLKGPDGFVTTPNYELKRNVIRGYFAITKSAENPALIVHWLDYFYSAEGAMLRMGREGIEWRKAKDGELDFNGNQAVYATLKTPETDPYYNNVDWSQNIPWYQSRESRESVVAAQDWKDPNISNGTEIQLFQGTKPYEAVAISVDQSLPPLSVPSDKIGDYSRYQTEITDYCKESLVKFITGDMNLTADWDAYKAQLDKLGLQVYMQLSNDAYANFLKR